MRQDVAVVSVEPLTVEHAVPSATVAQLQVRTALSPRVSIAKLTTASETLAQLAQGSTNVHVAAEFTVTHAELPCSLQTTLPETSYASSARSANTCAR